jgi:hypothetical protein
LGGETEGGGGYWTWQGSGTPVFGIDFLGPGAEFIFNPGREKLLKILREIFYGFFFIAKKILTKILRDDPGIVPGISGSFPAQFFS